MVIQTGTDASWEGKMKPDTIKNVGALTGGSAMAARRRQRNQRLFTSVDKSMKVTERLQVLCPGTDPLDAEIKIVPLQELASFREQPRYEIIYFTFAEDARLARTLIPHFQYCRLLLRPGGWLTLLLPGEGPEGLRAVISTFLPMSRHVARKNYPADLLRAAGFTDVRVLARPGQGKIVLGRRPSPFWRRGR